MIYSVTRSDYYFVGISSVGHQAYSPILPGRGAVGTTGNYRLVLSMAAGGNSATNTSAMFAASSTSSGDSTSSTSRASSSSSNVAATVPATSPSTFDAIYATYGQEEEEV